MSTNNAGTVGLGNLGVAQQGAVWEFPSVGSCVAVCVLDPEARVAGVAHAMLPNSRGNTATELPAKYVDQAIAALLDRLIANGADPSRMLAAYCGCADLLTGPQPYLPLSIGSCNGSAVRTGLEHSGIRCMGSHVGGHHRRSVRFDSHTGEVRVKAGLRPEVVICNLLEEAA